MATNKVVYGNNTLIDLTSDTATPNDVASGVTFHDRSGVAQTGSYVAPTITDITPSNSDPVTLTEGNNYAITGNGGKAIESLVSSRVSSNSWVYIHTNDIVRNIGSNDAVLCEPIDITPSNISPATMWGVGFYHTDALKGYLIESYSDIAPSNSNPATITSGSIYKATANGKAVESITNVTPSNSSPVALTSGDIDKIGGNGYAIASYSDKTPDDTTPPSVSSGEFVKMGGAGYLYASQQTTTSVTPSDSNPPLLTADTKYTPTANGYLYETQQSGGVTLNPSQLTAVCVRNTTSTVTVDTTKHYIVTATMRITGAAVRGGSWYVNEGVVTELTVTSDANANVTISGSTLTLQGTQASYNIEFHVIQLD